MPCYEERRGPETITLYKEGVSPDILSAEKEKARRLEAVVCALLNEIDRRGIAENVIACASRDGLIDIMEFWVKHRNDDEARIAESLHKIFSKDEQRIIKMLLNDLE